MAHKWIKWLIVLILFIFTPCYAFDWKGLTADNIANRVITSLEEEPEKWLIRGSRLYYFEEDDFRESVRDSSFPGSYDQCLIDISYSVLYDDGYVILYKPFKINIKEDEEKVARVIRQVLYEYLHNTYNTRMPEKKVVVEKPIEIIEEEPKPVQQAKKKKSNDRYENIVQW